MTGGWEEIDDCFDTPFACTSILDDPRKIYEYLRSKVYKHLTEPLEIITIL